MFSCRRAVRLTLDQLERPLSLAECLGRWGHLLICTACRRHNRQVRGLAFLLRCEDEASLASTMPASAHLSAAARSRIAGAMADRMGSQTDFP